MKNRIRRIAVIVMIFAVMMVLCSFSYPFGTYNVTYENEVIAAAESVKFSRTASGVDLGIGHFNSPMSLRVSKQGDIFVADTGNSRVVVTDKNYNVKFVIKSFERDGIEDSLKEPNGVFIRDNGEIFIADTGNKRVIVFSPEGKFLREMPEPKSIILGENFVYQPTGLVLDTAGRMYVVAKNVNQGLMEFDENGNFKGFMGANRVDADPLTILLKRFSTEEQLERMDQIVPTEYNNIAIDSLGFIYTTTSAIPDSAITSAVLNRSKDERNAPIRKLNASGVDVLSRQGTFMPVGDTTFVDTTNPKLGGPSEIRDITVDSNAFYTVLDSKRGHVFKYDHRGNLLYQFGGLSNTNSGFRTPISLSQLDNRYLILDVGRQCIVEYTETEYGTMINQATQFYIEGNYDESKILWEKVLKLNGNSEVAYSGLGLIEFREKNYKEAVNYFKLGQDRENYSKAYEKYRSIVIRENFNYIALAVVGILVVIVILIIVVKAKKKYKKIMDLYSKAAKSI